ncbi:hypothetical protein OG333_37155 (plasmid) [Streptomyces anulatus]|uniref:hypothetical protein n=1 Tax=Streptomyces anulatus TaxID=1892 RepID=UPI002F9071F3|nr:hypothetical protein OG333_37155 [Streptomyces anulatus]
MTSDTLTAAQKRQMAEDAALTLGLDPRLLRLLSAVHEAGHAIVAHTVGLSVTSATVTSHELIGLGGDHIALDYHAHHGRIPLPSLLAMRVAGFQASVLWLGGRGIDGTTEPYQATLNGLAGSDLNWCADACQRLLPHAHAQDTIEIAGRILLHRWRSTLRLAYDLAAAGSMDAVVIQPYLESDPMHALAAMRSYRIWREATAAHWAERPAVPSQ